MREFHKIFLQIDIDFGLQVKYYGISYGAVIVDVIKSPPYCVSSAPNWAECKRPPQRLLVS